MSRSDDSVSHSRRVFAGALLAAACPNALRSEHLRAETKDACLYVDEALGHYGFPEGHPLGVDRQGAFLREAQQRGLLDRVHSLGACRASRAEIERFHSAEYVTRVETAEAMGVAVLDSGDTPVFPGVYSAASDVVGAALDGLERVMTGGCRRAFQPIGGLHHAGRGHAAGFCVFNDLGVVIETLRRQYDVRRIAYVDIDVHFGDGVFYAFEEDPDLISADVHQDGRTLYPGGGRRDETGKGGAAGTKLNLPLLPGSGDDDFMVVWPEIEAHLEKFAPEFFLFQCGADGLCGDPLANLNYSARVHAHTTIRLRALANRHAEGRIMAFGGGGYNRSNLARAWSEVLAALID